MADELEYEVTAVEPEGDDLQVKVTWTVVRGEEREQVLQDVLLVPVGSPAEGVEAAIARRAESYVRPRYLAAPAEVPAELAALVGQSGRAGELAARLEAGQVAALQVAAVRENGRVSR